MEKFTLKENCTLCYYEDYLNSSQIQKVKQFLSKYKTLKQIYCTYWIRGLCIFPASICPYAHGIEELEYISPNERNESEQFYHVNKDKSMKFENLKEKIPIYILLPSFQAKLLEEGLITASELYNQSDFDADHEKRYKIRTIYQKREGLKFVKHLYNLSKNRNFVLTKTFIENEIRRVKLNKMNVKLHQIIEDSPFILIGVLFPPWIDTATETVVLKEEADNYEQMHIEKKIYLTIKPNETPEDKMKILNEYLQYIPLNKGVLCNFWLRGFCVFEKENCKNAHGILDLTPDAFQNTEISEEIKDDPKKFIKLRLVDRVYKNYFDYQEILLSKGLIKESDLCGVDDINFINEKKLFLREIILKEEAKIYLHELFKRNKSKYLTKNFCGKMFRKIEFKPPGNIYNCEYFYETKASIPSKVDNSKNNEKHEEVKNNNIEEIDKIENNNKKKNNENNEKNTKNMIKANVVLEVNFEELTEFMEIKMKKIIGEIQQNKQNFPMSLIQKCYYKEIKSMDPTLFHFLKIKDMSFLEYLRELEGKKIINLEGNTSLENEDSQKGKEIINEIYKFWNENKTKQGFCKKLKLKIEIDKKLNEKGGPLGKNELEKILFCQKIPIIQLHSDIYILNYNIFAENKIHKHQEKPCKFLINQGKHKNLNLYEKNGKIPIKNKFSRITMIEDLSSFQESAEFLINFKEFGVDLEGKLNYNGGIDLIQISIEDENTSKIFIFDIFVLKSSVFFTKVKGFLKDLFENPDKRKIFFDCRKDSLALHLYLDIHCQNVIDLAGFHMFITSLQIFVENHENIENFNEYIQQLQRNKIPGLNDVLDRYGALHGKNPLKEEMKMKFSKENKDFFHKRPIPEDFIEYSAKDVEDLSDVLKKMILKTNEILLMLNLKIDEAVLVNLLERISQRYVKQGCLD